MTRKLPNYVLNAIFLIWISAVGYYFFHTLDLPQKNSSGSAVADASFGWKYPVAKFPATGPSQLAFSDIRDPGGMVQGLPVRLKIPEINVDSAIEDAYITSDGRMDVPAGSKNVSWFSLGPHPGQIGSAVIGGHYGISNGNPFVFYNLNKLKIGNKVYIENDEGKILTFIVRSIKTFDRNADATTVFTSEDGLAHLNLITCEGVWNQVNDSYPDRLVIFTDAIPTEVTTPISPKLPETEITTKQIPSNQFEPTFLKDIISPTDKVITTFLIFIIIYVIIEILRPVINKFVH